MTQGNSEVLDWLKRVKASTPMKVTEPVNEPIVNVEPCLVVTSDDDLGSSDISVTVDGSNCDSHTDQPEQDKSNVSEIVNFNSLTSSELNVFLSCGVNEKTVNEVSNGTVNVNQTDADQFKSTTSSVLETLMTFEDSKRAEELLDQSPDIIVNRVNLLNENLVEAGVSNAWEFVNAIWVEMLALRCLK